MTHQQRIFMILKSLAIEFEPVDIAGPGMDNQKDVMRAKGKKKEGQRHALPPQIFNGDKYCGVSTERQNELYSEVSKLFSQSSTGVVPDMLPGSMLGGLTAYQTYCTIHFVS